MGNKFIDHTNSKSLTMGSHLLSTKNLIAYKYSLHSDTTQLNSTQLDNVNNS